MSVITEKEIGTIILITREIETILKEEFNATGKGLHAQISSVDNKLPINMIKTLRWIATVRNNAIHEHDFQIKNLPSYKKQSNEIIEHLKYIIESKKAEQKKLFNKINLNDYDKDTLIGLSIVSLFALGLLWWIFS